MEVDPSGRHWSGAGHRDDRFHRSRLMRQAGKDASPHSTVVTAEHPVMHPNQRLNTTRIDLIRDQAGGA